MFQFPNFYSKLLAVIFFLKNYLKADGSLYLLDKTFINETRGGQITYIVFFCDDNSAEVYHIHSHF